MKHFARRQCKELNTIFLHLPYYVQGGILMVNIFDFSLSVSLDLKPLLLSHFHTDVLLQHPSEKNHHNYTQK